jgi:hypothetical protein
VYFAQGHDEEALKTYGRRAAAISESIGIPTRLSLPPFRFPALSVYEAAPHAQTAAKIGWSKAAQGCFSRRVTLKN